MVKPCIFLEGLEELIQIAKPLDWSAFINHVRDELVTQKSWKESVFIISWAHSLSFFSVKFYLFCLEGKDMPRGDGFLNW